MPKRFQAVQAYLVAFGMASLAVLLQWAIRPMSGNQVPFLFVLPALMLASTSLGRGPALIVLAAGGINAWLMAPPTGTWAVSDIHDVGALGAYLIVGFAIVTYGWRTRLIQARGKLAEERLMLAQEATGVGVFELDFQAGSAFVSPSLCQLLGRPVTAGPIALEQWLGALDRSHVDESRRVLEEKVARRELSYEREQHVKLPDGRERWLSSRVRIDLTSAGTLARARGATVDITERKQLDERLQSARAELRAQIEDLRRLHVLSQELVVAGDDLAQPTQALLELVVALQGATHGLLALRGRDGAPSTIIAHTNLGEDVLAQMARVPFGKNVAWDELLQAYRTLARQQGLHDVSCTSLLSTAGDMLGVICVLHPRPHQMSDWEIRMSELCAMTAAAVLARERARTAAVRNAQRFAVTMESSAVPFNILAPVRDALGSIVDLRWSYLNPAAARLMGHEAADILGRRVTELLPRNWDTPGLLERYVGVIDRGEHCEFETNSARRPEIWLHVNASPLEGSAAVWFTDISQLKRNERALREADRRKDEFLATLAHELRNPLAPIRQAVRIARAAAASEAQKRWGHDVIERQVRNMALLLDDLLDVARITNGSLQLRKSSVTLASLADAALESALPYIESKQHHLVRDLPEPDAILAVDALRISQVIGNLLTNAAKYTDPRGRITLSARRDGPQWLISVADNGVGISPEQLGRLFEMFAQLPTSAGRSQGGLGIGLALSRALVRLHGGDITATSAGAGGGSVFTVRLPAEPMASDSEPSGAAPDAGAARIAVPALRVLVADDNADAAESLAALLRIDGHEVHVAYDGEQALAAFSQLEPQAALLDVGMPRLSGLEVARAIRRLPAGKRAVMIALTGWGQPRDRSEALEAGFDHHTTKPVDPTHIQALIAASRTRNG